MTNEQQIQVIHGCANGVSVSQKILFMEYSGVLLGVCKRYIRDHSEAKDVLQDSFVRIFKFAHKYDHEGVSLLGWMKTICIRIALQKIKKNKRTASIEELDYSRTKITLKKKLIKIDLGSVNERSSLNY